MSAVRVRRIAIDKILGLGGVYSPEFFWSVERLMYGDWYSIGYYDTWREAFDRAVLAAAGFSREYGRVSRLADRRRKTNQSVR